MKTWTQKSSLLGELDVVQILYGLLICTDKDVMQFLTLLTKIAKIRSNSYVKLWKDMRAGKTRHQPLALAESLSSRNCQVLFRKNIFPQRGDIKKMHSCLPVGSGWLILPFLAWQFKAWCCMSRKCKPVSLCDKEQLLSSPFDAK